MTNGRAQKFGLLFGECTRSRDHFYVLEFCALMSGKLLGERAKRCAELLSFLVFFFAKKKRHE